MANLELERARTGATWRWWVLAAAIPLAGIALATVLSLSVGGRATPPVAPERVPEQRPARASEAKRYSFPRVALALTGIVRKGGEALALIRVDSRPGQAYAAGEEVVAGVRVIRIGGDRVVVGYRDLTNTLYLQQRKEDDTGSEVALVQRRQPVGTEFTKNPHIDPSSVNTTSISAAREFLREVKVTSRSDGGFLVQEVEPGSLYEKMGLRPEDVVYNMDVFAKYAGSTESRLAGIYAGDAALEVIRDGALLILKYRPE